MAPKGVSQKAAKAKAKVKQGITKKTGAKGPSEALNRQVLTCQLACNFRNTMKYRMSDTCKKAFGVEPVHLACHMCKRANTLCRKGQ